TRSPLSFQSSIASSASDAGRQMERYTRTAMVLHWLIALAVLAQIGFGWYLQQVPRRTPERTIYVNYHKSTGMLIGLLILLRIATSYVFVALIALHLLAAMKHAILPQHRILRRMLPL